jgi:RNA polymerase sigma-70 factor (ECF subfamily)
LSGGDTDAPDGLSLEALMTRHCEGDRKAFEILFAHLAPRVNMLLLRLSRNRELAEELTQVTFLKVHRARETYVPGAKVVPWVMAIARNVYIDAYRKHRVKRRYETLTEEGTLPESARVPYTDAANLVELSEEAQRRIQETLDNLPANQREALMLLKVEGMSLKEVAAVTGASVAAVKVRAFRAYEALRNALGVARKRPPLSASSQLPTRSRSTP